ncbi:DUF6798 domain-containing protein [Denitrobaculum tricleocarpae]|uniref:DUF6798 domain-containing protein n=1 Tax=Denitrobaculum tricleocarpae TaxID=2591009 RepID=A0A545T5D8_9PROT|nr:DUF6798 domain-containing protein [Denitrobaculum tricleocarpae]TQV72451.1 hypothetical protein FKG95_25595 [Denitrobaculum tricleocarpae]
MNKFIRYEYILYIVLFALAAVFFRQYTIVSLISNQVSQMPLVMRELDPGFLVNDWYVNEMSGLNGRTFFVALVAGTARILGLESAYFALYLLGVLFSASVIYYATARVFKGGETAGLIAALLVMSWELHDFGEVLQIVSADLIPAHLAKSLSLLAILLALQGRGAACGIIAGVTSLLQPLLGVACGIMALGTLLVVATVTIEAKWRPVIKFKRSALMSGAAGFLCLLPFAVFWARLSSSTLDLESYVHVVATIRNPHHYLPSTWGPTQYLLTALFLCATAILFAALRRSPLPEASARVPGTEPATADSPAKAILAHQTYLFIFAAGLVLLCVLGYLFVEVWPIRMFVTLQAYRYLYIFLWFAIIFAAIAAAQIGREGSFAKCCVFCLLLLGANGTLQPVIFILGAGAYYQWTRHPERRLQVSEMALAAAAGFLILVSFRDYHPQMAGILLSLVVAALAVLAMSFRQTWLRLALLACLAGSMGMVATFAGQRLSTAAAQMSERFNIRSYPTFDAVMTDDEGQNRTMRALLEAAAFAKRELPEDAVFLTPPNFGAFRIFAERAIVVDFKSWTFGDPAGWLARLENAYGALDGPGVDTGEALDESSGQGLGGFALMRRLDARYKEISDRKIAGIAQQYGVRYAVLYRATETNYPAVFEGRRYKIVALSNRRE